MRKTKGLTARLVRIDGPNENNITYADARLSDGGKVSGIGWSLEDPEDPTGKYCALWNLARRLTKLGVEVE